MKLLTMSALFLYFTAVVAFAFSKKPATPPAPVTSYSTITSVGTWGSISPAPVVAPVQQKPSPITQPSNTSPSVTCATVALEKACPAPGANLAVDVSEPVTQKFLCAARQLGVKTVIRYYEYVNETIKGKTPSIAELKLIKANGMNFVGVFQHNNSSPATFTSARGSADAARSVELAKQWKQPPGSAIYFGVDFEPSAAQLKNVVVYATNFAKVARGAGFKVGVYGSGDTLKTLKVAGLVDFTWVSQSTGFSGTKAYTASKQWDLLQGMPKTCGSINVDFDAAKPDVGQWTVTL